MKIKKLWLKMWLYVIIILSTILGTYLIINFKNLDFMTIGVILSIISLTLHVFEEWKFPGGFFYMYNKKNDKEKINRLDRYPMNQLTDMITNFVPILFGFVTVFININHIFSLMWLFLAVMEVFIHTKIGIGLKHGYKEYGKKTIYNPGLFTSWFCFLPSAIIIIYSFFRIEMPSIIDFILAIILTLVMSFLVINLTENKLKDTNSPYYFSWGEGYFKKFTKNNKSN